MSSGVWDPCEQPCGIPTRSGVQQLSIARVWCVLKTKATLATPDSIHALAMVTFVSIAVPLEKASR